MRNKKPKTVSYRRNIFYITCLLAEMMVGVGLVLFTISIANPENGFYSGFGLVMALFLGFPIWITSIAATIWWFHVPKEVEPLVLPSSGGDE